MCGWSSKLKVKVLLVFTIYFGFRVCIGVVEIYIVPQHPHISDFEVEEGKWDGSLGLGMEEVIVKQIDSDDFSGVPSKGGRTKGKKGKGHWRQRSQG